MAESTNGDEVLGLVETQTQSVISELRGLLPKGVVLDDEDVSKRAEGWASSESCYALAVALPRTTEEVSAILQCCHRHGVGVVPYGGGTGLVGGAVAAPDQVLLSLERMNRVVRIDSVNRIALVEAGATLQRLHEAACEEDVMYPVDLGARGSATIGGTVSTNAGGNRVIRYGMTRENVLGLEAVLADGTIVSSLNMLLKNNSGYDIKHLFIGAEGTLGVVTKVVLRLREVPTTQNSALLSVSNFSDVVHLLKLFDQRLGGSLSAFEVMWREFYDSVTAPAGDLPPPLPRGAPLYILVESLGSNAEADPELLEAILADAFESGHVTDAVIATSGQQVQSLWKIRDDVERLLSLGPMFMFDVSLPISEMDEYIRSVRAAIDSSWPKNECVVWGHVGDSNLHIWVTVFSESDEAKESVEECIYSPLRHVNGSVSAEHGIGTEKKHHLHYTRNPAELDVMAKLKAVLDPGQTMNPGKIL